MNGRLARLSTYGHSIDRHQDDIDDVVARNLIGKDPRHPRPDAELHVLLDAISAGRRHLAGDRRIEIALWDIISARASASRSCRLLAPRRRRSRSTAPARTMFEGDTGM